MVVGSSPTGLTVTARGESDAVDAPAAPAYQGRMPPLRFRPADVRGRPGLRAAAGGVEVGVVPGVGGRIASLRLDGEEVLFVEARRWAAPFDAAAVRDRDLEAAKRALGFPLWGGDKTWVSPQTAWRGGTPPLDLDSGAYEARVEGAAVLLTSPLCRETGVRITRRIEVRPGGAIALEETIRNEGAAPAERGVWNVTQVGQPFDVFLPVPPEGLRTYEEEGSEAVVRRLVRAEGRWTRIACDAAVRFKVGATPAEGLVVALRRDGAGTLALVRRFEVRPGARYAHGASVEVFHQSFHPYLEIEAHAPFAPIPPGGSTTLRQTWRLERLAAGAGPDEAAALLSA